MTRPATRHPGALLAWIAAMSAVATALWVTGRGALAAPTLLAPHTWGTWLRDREPVVAAFAITRLGALAAISYLAGSTALGIAARLLRARPLVALSDALTVPAVRRLLQGALGVSLAATPVTTNWRMPVLPAPGVAVAAVDGESTDAGFYETATMRRLPDPTAAAVPVAAPLAPPASVEATWTVRPGDHFWGIASRTLTTAWGRAPSDAELIPYWTALISANRPALADPANPSLIHPGQRFRLPPPPPPGV